MNRLPEPARRLILGVCAVGSIIAAGAAIEWRGEYPVKLAVWISIAVLAATAKVRFHRLETAYSFGYVVALAAVSTLPLFDAILISAVTGIVQCYWRTSKSPMGIQVLFNVFNYVISAAASWCAFHELARIAPNLGMPAYFASAAGIFFLANTGLICWILSILNGSGFIEIWERSHLLIFPYYMVGAVITGLLAWYGRGNAWLLVASGPVLGLLYISARVRIGTAERKALAANGS